MIAEKGELEATIHEPEPKSDPKSKAKLELWAWVAMYDPIINFTLLGMCSTKRHQRRLVNIAIKGVIKPAAWVKGLVFTFLILYFCSILQVVTRRFWPLSIIFDKDIEF